MHAPVAHVEVARRRTFLLRAGSRHLRSLMTSSSLRSFVHRRFAEKGGSDVEDGADLGGCALREHRALVEHLNPVAVAHDQCHVVDRSTAHRRRGRRRSSARATRSRAPRPRAAPRPARPAGRSAAPSRARGRRRAAARRRARAPTPARRHSGRGRDGRAGRRRGASPPPAAHPSRGPTPRRSRDGQRAKAPAVLEGAASPRRPRRCADQRVITCPSSSTVPSSGRSKPLSTLTSVDLPAPFGPIRPTISLRPSSSVTPRSACTPSNERETEEARRVSPGLLPSDSR